MKTADLQLTTMNFTVVLEAMQVPHHNILIHRPHLLAWLQTPAETVLVELKTIRIARRGHGGKNPKIVQIKSVNSKIYLQNTSCHAQVKHPRTTEQNK